MRKPDPNTIECGSSTLAETLDRLKREGKHVWRCDCIGNAKYRLHYEEAPAQGVLL
jgi:hypothetical protein